MKVSFWLKNIIIFVGLFGMVYWFFVQAKTAQPADMAPKPQEYMTNLQSTKFDLFGNRKETISADYWEFSPSLGCSDLVKPRLVVYKLNGDVWYLSSNKAIAWHPSVSEQITKIDMLDGVVIERPALNKSSPVKLETLALQYTPAEEMISTKEFVSMQQPGLTISGYGLLGYLDRNGIELHDKITTVYTPS